MSGPTGNKCRKRELRLGWCGGGLTITDARRGQVIPHLACPGPRRELNSIFGGVRGETRTRRAHRHQASCISHAVSGRTSSGRLRICPSAQTEFNRLRPCSRLPRAPRNPSHMLAYKERSHICRCRSFTGPDPREGISPELPEQKQMTRVRLVRAFADVLPDACTLR